MLLNPGKYSHYYILDTQDHEVQPDRNSLFVRLRRLSIRYKLILAIIASTFFVMVIVASLGSTMKLKKSDNIADKDIILPDSLKPIENSFKVLKSISRHAPKSKSSYNSILGILKNKSLQRIDR